MSGLLYNEAPNGISSPLAFQFARLDQYECAIDKLLLVNHPAEWTDRDKRCLESMTSEDRIE